MRWPYFQADLPRFFGCRRGPADFNSSVALGSTEPGYSYRPRSQQPLQLLQPSIRQGLELIRPSQQPVCSNHQPVSRRECAAQRDAPLATAAVVLTSRAGLVGAVARVAHDLERRFGHRTVQVPCGLGRAHHVVPACRPGATVASSNGCQSARQTTQRSVRTLDDHGRDVPNPIDMIQQPSLPFEESAIHEEVVLDPRERKGELVLVTRHLWFGHRRPR